MAADRLARLITGHAHWLANTHALGQITTWQAWRQQFFAAQTASSSGRNSLGSVLAGTFLLVLFPADHRRWWKIATPRGDPHIRLRQGQAKVRR